MSAFQACQAFSAHPSAGPNLASLGQCLEMGPRDPQMIISKFTKNRHTKMHKYWKRRSKWSNTAPLSSPLEQDYFLWDLQILEVQVEQVFPPEAVYHEGGNSGISCWHYWDNKNVYIKKFQLNHPRR